MPKINVFKDKDGDFVVTTADAVAPGVAAFQLSGSKVTAETAVSKLQGVPGFVLLLESGRLGKDTGDFIASLKHELVFTAEVDEDDTVYQVLADA
jgi:hypothetical protein